MTTTEKKALEAAVRCLNSIERNERHIEAAIRAADPKMVPSWVSTVGGWKRNLAHARAALAAAQEPAAS